MIRINPNYLFLFKMSYGSYTYCIDKGLLLSFDSKTLEYKEVVDYLNRYNKYDMKVNEALNTLISRDILEVF